jgi:hypothetical protein
MVQFKRCCVKEQVGKISYNVLFNAVTFCSEILGNKFLFMLHILEEDSFYNQP